MIPLLNQQKAGALENNSPQTAHKVTKLTLFQPRYQQPSVSFYRQFSFKKIMNLFMRALSMKIFCGCSFIAGLFVCTAALADPEGHGPDAWQIVDVEEFDALPARMGPGEEYTIITEFMAGERGLQEVTCVPYLPAAYRNQMDDAEYDDLPDPWCLLRSADYSAGGWIPSRFMAEDSIP